MAIFIQDRTAYDIVCGNSNNDNDNNDNNNDNNNNNNNDNSDNSNDDNNDNHNDNEKDCTTAITEFDSDLDCATTLDACAETSPQNTSSMLCNAPCSTLIQTAIDACTNMAVNSVS